MTNQVIPVVVGLVLNASGDVLIAKRPDGKPWAGYWEFPGGKVESDESQQQALTRELEEEIGIRVSQAEFLFDLLCEDGDVPVQLFIYRVVQFDGAPFSKEGQLVRWAPVARLATYKMPPANKAIYQYLSQSAAAQFEFEV